MQLREPVSVCFCECAYVCVCALYVCGPVRARTPGAITGICVEETVQNIELLAIG